MATENVSTDQSTPTLEQVEKEVKEEAKIMEEEIDSSLLQESEEKPKDEGTPSATIVSLVQPEEKVEEKQSEPPKVEEVVKAEVEEKPKAEPEEKTEDKHIENPDQIPVLDDSSTDAQEMAKESAPVSVSGGVDDTIKSEPEGTEVKNLELPQDEPTTEPQEEEPKKIHIPESGIEGVEGKEEQVEDLLDITGSTTEAIEAKEEEVKELTEKIDIPESATEAVEAKEEEVKGLPERIDIPEASIQAAETKVEQVEELPKTIDIPEPVREAIETKEKQVKELPPKEQEAIMAEKPDEKLETTEQIEKEAAVVEPEEKFEVEAIKDRDISTDEISDTKLVEGVEAATVEFTTREISAEVTEKNGDKEKGLIAKPETRISLEEMLERTRKEIEAEDSKTEQTKERVSAVEELTQPEAKEADHATSTISTSEDSGKDAEAETGSGGIELPSEIGSRIDETAASVGTEKDTEVEKKVDVEEPQKVETETKAEEAAEAVETKLEQDSREVDDLNPTQEEAPKEGATGKSTQKSNNILSKMKQSLVKAKKAIIGKSPSKTPPPSETKEEIKS